MPAEPAADTPDPITDVEPTAAEIASAAEAERRDNDEAARTARRAAKTATAAKRGPGRPPGSKNRNKGETAARDRARSTPVAATRPANPPALGGAAANAHRDRLAREREARKETVKAWTDKAREFRPGLATGVGMVTGIPADFLVGFATDAAGRIVDNDGQPVKVDPNGAPLPGESPAMALTPYGAAITPQDWQIRTVVEAAVRFADSDQGAAFMEWVERFMPYGYGLAAVGAVGVYAVSAMQAAGAIKPMVEMEMKSRAEAAAQAAAQANAADFPTPDDGSAGPVG